jgi:hypothetical protein
LPLKDLDARREYQRKNMRRWARSNPERARSIRVRYDTSHKDELLRRERRYRALYPEKRRTQNRKHSLRKYGLTPDEYTAMHQAQNGICALCKKPETSRLRGTLRALAVDHCHRTGVVRGLLCRRCNMMIGMADDDADTFLAAVSYLRQPFA